MPSGYTNIWGTRAALPPRYYGNIAYYLAVASHGGDAYMDGNRLFDKRQKSVHRCDIADVRGQVQLTVPIAKPHGISRATWADVAVSEHGQWWHVHRVTLESAYGRTPFFEFYIDRFLPFLRPDTPQHYPSIVQLDRAIDAEIRRILLLPEQPDVAATSPTAETPFSTKSANNHLDLAPIPTITIDAATDYTALIEPYWQVRSATLGFMPNLSILDLIFNLGPEASLYLAGIASRQP